MNEIKAETSGVIAESCREWQASPIRSGPFPCGVEIGRASFQLARVLIRRLEAHATFPCLKKF